MLSSVLGRFGVISTGVVLFCSPLLWSSSVSGRVIDHKGNPVAGATVMLMIVNRSGVFPSTVSDQGGFFRFGDVPAGVLLEIDARKEEAYLISPGILKAGFPAGGKSPPTFRVGQNQNLTDQIVQFGPPGGRFVIDFRSPDGKKGWHRNFMYKISKKGKKPAFDRFFFSFDVVIPPGSYEMQLFSQDGRYFKTIEIVVEPRKITRQVVEVSPEFIAR